MTSRVAYLIGGSPAFAVTAPEFVTAAGGSDARIALLMQGGPDWQKYVPEYTNPWLEQGVSHYDVIVPGADGKLDLQNVLPTLQQATGIFVGGGHTPTYHLLYATEPVRSIIRQQYEKGIPFAGVSAGALIACEYGLFSAAESSDGALHVVKSLGLLHDLVIGVHFSELNALPDMLEAMARTKIAGGWGIDEAACAVFQDGRFKKALGQDVYRIVMTDWENKTYHQERVAR